MLNRLHAFRNAVALARYPGTLLVLARGNLELWANLFVITWAVAFMLWQGFGFAVSIGTVFAIWAILAVSLNLVLGFTGLLSVGHVGFFGIGAYATAILTSTTAYEQLRTEAIPTFGLPFFAALPVSVALAGLVALAVGVVFNRFRDDIFVLVSFGFAIISFNVFLNWRGLTRGAFGIHDVPRPEIAGWVFDGELEFLVLTLVFLVLVMAVAWFIVTSSFGRVLTAIREDEQAIEVFGYRATHYKLAIWVISAMMAGLAGSLFSSWTTFIDPFFVHPARVYPPGGNRDIGRGSPPFGVPSSAQWPSCCWRRECVFCPWCLPSTPGRPGKSSWVSSWCCSCSSGHKAWSGGTSYDLSPQRHRRALRSGDGQDIQALWRRQGGGPTQPLHPPGGSDQHSRTQWVREIYPG